MPLVPLMARKHTRLTFQSPGDDDTPSSVFENQDGDFVTGGFALVVKADDSGVFDTANPLISPWGATPTPNDAIYVGHPNLMASVLAFDIDGVPDDLSARFEYFDGRFRVRQPDFGTVAVSGPGIQMDVDGLLFASSATPADHTGLRVRVRSKSTGDTEIVTVTFDGTNNQITTGGTLGQLVVSTQEAKKKEDLPLS